MSETPILGDAAPRSVVRREYPSGLMRLAAILVLSAVSYFPVRWAAEQYGASWVRDGNASTVRASIVIAVAASTILVALCTALYMRKNVLKARRATFSGAALFYLLMPGGVYSVFPFNPFIYQHVYSKLYPDDDFQILVNAWTFLGAPLLSYVISGVFVTGIRDVAFRFIAFFLAWSGLYSLILVLTEWHRIVL